MDAEMHIFLETERLLLRRFTPADQDNLVELDSDPEVMRYINGGSPTPRSEIENDVLPAFMAYYARGDRYGFWAVIEKSSGRFLGWFHFRPPHGSDSEDIVELGYRFRKDAWGKGYTTEGSRALIDKGFNDLGVQRVFAMAYEENIGSWRVMQKAGLRHVRTFRLSPEDPNYKEILEMSGGELWDGNDVEYALTREQWEQQQVTKSRDL